MHLHGTTNATACLRLVLLFFLKRVANFLACRNVAHANNPYVRTGSISICRGSGDFRPMAWDSTSTVEKKDALVTIFVVAGIFFLSQYQ
jgi:hypothetical protein